MRPRVRYGIPLLFVVALIPCLVTTQGGPFGGGIYNAVMFVISLPALYAIGSLRDHGLLVTLAQEFAAAIVLQYLCYFAIVSLIGAVVAAIRRHPKTDARN